MYKKYMYCITMFLCSSVFISTFAHFKITYKDHSDFAKQDNFFSLQWDYQSQSFLSDKKEEKLKGILNSHNTTEEFKFLSDLTSSKLTIDLYAPNKIICGTLFIKHEKAQYPDDSHVSFVYEATLSAFHDSFCAHHKMNVKIYKKQETTQDSSVVFPYIDTFIKFNQNSERFVIMEEDKISNHIDLTLERSDSEITTNRNPFLKLFQNLCCFSSREN